MVKHNKKRNTLLLYEFLARALVKSFIDNNEKQASSIKEIIHKYFHKGTQLHKEYKLMKALATINVSSDSTVQKIFEDVKQFSKTLNSKTLNKEKTKLISEIHNHINDNDFYKQDVPDYVKYATIQNLINEYCSKDSKDFEGKIRVTMFEDAIKSALREENNMQHHAINLEDKKVYNSSTVKFIVSRFNDKYNTLNENQRAILSSICFKQDALKSCLKNTRNAILNKIRVIEVDEELSADSDIMQKLKVVKEEIKKIDEKSLDDKISDGMIEDILRLAEVLNYNA
mgnify:CR=1 FL=1